MVLEIHIEKYLVKRVRELGGVAEKLHPLGRVGRTDRLVAIPNWRPFYCEVKRPKNEGGRVKPKQVLNRKRLQELGFPVYIVWNEAQIDEMLETEYGKSRQEGRTPPEWKADPPRTQEAGRGH